MSRRGSGTDLSTSSSRMSSFDKALIGTMAPGILITLVSFFSPQWVVRWERGFSESPLKSLGLWMIELENLHLPEDQYNRNWDGFYWIWSRRFSFAFYPLSERGFFITVQVFCLVGMLLLLAAAFLLILYFVTIMIEAKLKRLLISSCLFLVGGLLYFLGTIMFCTQHIQSDRWLFKWFGHYHRAAYYSWGFGFAIVGCVLVLWTAGIGLIHYRRQQRFVKSHPSVYQVDSYHNGGNSSGYPPSGYPPSGYAPSGYAASGNAPSGYAPSYHPPAKNSSSNRRSSSKKQQQQQQHQQPYHPPPGQEGHPPYGPGGYPPQAQGYPPMGYYYIPAGGEPGSEGQGGFWYGPVPPGGWPAQTAPPNQEESEDDLASSHDGDLDDASVESNHQSTMESTQSRNSQGKSSSQKQLVKSPNRKARY